MDGYVQIGTKLDTKSFDAQIKEVEYELEQIEFELSKKKELRLDTRTISQYEEKAEKLNNRLLELRQKQEDLNKTNLTNVQKSMENVSDTTSKTIKKVGKWALAIFSVRSAYMVVRSAVSSLTEYNEQLATDIKYINFAFASMLQPVIEAIVNLVFKLLTYINYVAQALFGVNLFANATQEAFNKTNDEATALKKTLTGFDEMNVLGDSSSGNAQNVYSPSTDLSKINSEGEKLKKFWDDIFNFWDEDWKNWFTDIDGEWGLFVEGLGLTLKGFVDVFKGVFDSISGVFLIFVGIFTGNTEKIKEGWEKLVNGIGKILTGLIEIAIGVAMTILGTIKGLLSELFNAVVSIFGTIGNFIYENVIKKIIDFFGYLGNQISNIVSNIVNNIKNTFYSIVGFFSNIISTILGFFKTIGTSVGNVIGTAFKAVVNGVLSAIENILNFPINSINSLIKVINKVPGIDLGRLPTFNLPRLAVGGVVNMPGRGINYGGANIGERGAEGVIPLTNSQMMAQLGEAIGRYVTINANITNTMNGRIISRELQKINNNSDFAFNR